MAKRGAEEQITKDDEDRRRNDSDEEDEVDVSCPNHKTDLYTDL